MPIHHAVLALLTAGPSYGYQLKVDFERAIGPQWGELNIGHLYQVLDRLERDGLVRHRVVAQRGKPDKTVYRLTQTGRHELDAWLERPAHRQSGYRDDFFLQLFAASRLGTQRVQEVTARHRHHCLTELHALTELAEEHRTDPLISLLIEAALQHTQADLAVADQAARRANELAEVSQDPADVDADRETGQEAG